MKSSDPGYFGLVQLPGSYCASSRKTTREPSALFQTSPNPVDGEFEFSCPVPSPVQSPVPTGYLALDLILTDPPFGFSIRGGKELGVHVSRVAVGSPADRARLLPEDWIVSANGISFLNIRHRDALQILCSFKKLKLTLYRKAPVKPHHRDFTSSSAAYCHMWVDRHGRAVSPPIASSPSFELPLDHPSLKRTASYREGKDTRSFRKVIVLRQPGLPLGLTIRGGAERRLGIFVTSVEEASAADYAGLQVGDQILSVNDQDFTAVTRDEALDVLETSARMSIVVRSVGKMPRSPIPSLVTPTPYPNGNDFLPPAVPLWYNETVQPSTSLTRKRSSRKKKPDEKSPERRVVIEHSRLERKANKHLTESQKVSLFYYCEEYESGRLKVDDLVSLLLELLDNSEKYSLMPEIRALIRSPDLGNFDELIYNRGVKSKDTMKLIVDVHTDAAEMVQSPSPIENKKGPSPRGSLRASTRRRHLPQQQDVRHLTVPGGDRNPDTPSEDSGVDLPSYALGSRKGSRVSTASRDSILEHLQMKNTWRACHRSAPRRSLDTVALPSSEATRLRRTTLRRHSSGGEGVNVEERRSSYAKAVEDRRWSIGSEVPDTPVQDGQMDAAQAVLSRLEAIVLSRRHSHNLPRPPRISPKPPLSPNILHVPHNRVRRHRSLPDPVAIQARKRAQQLEQHQQHRTASVRIPGHRTIPEEDGRLRVIVKKSRPILGIAIEGGADTTQPLPRIISIHSSGAAFDAGGLKVGHIILEVDGLRTNGQSHNDVAQLIAHAFYRTDREHIELLVMETAKTTESEVRRASLFFE